MPAVSGAPFFRFLSRGLSVLTGIFADRYHLVRWEMLLARVLLGYALWQSLPYGPPGFTDQPNPHGLAQWFDFTWISNPQTFATVLFLGKAGLIMFMLGIAAPLGLCFFLVLDVSHHTFFTSQGIFGHGGNLNSLIALALLCGHLFHAARRRSFSDLLWSRAACEQTTLASARIMLAATYVVAGLSKITFGGFDWWTRGDCFVIQMLKAQDEMDFTMVQSPLSDSAHAFSQYLVAHPHLANGMLLSALLMEVGAFLACTGRVRGLIIGGSLALFHLGNEWLMGLPFRGNLVMDIILFIQPLSWLVFGLSFIPGFGTKLKSQTGMQPPVQPVISPPWWLQLGRLLAAPAVLSLFLGYFMLWRKEWYPFSHFPMYSVLATKTNALYMTDMNDTLIPFARLGLDAPTVKKLINTEMRKYKASGAVRRMSDLTDAHWTEAAEVVVKQMRENWKVQRGNMAFRLYRKDYTTENGVVTTKSTCIATFAPTNETQG